MMCTITALCNAVDGEANYYEFVWANARQVGREVEEKAFVTSCRDVEKFGPELIAREPQIFAEAIGIRDKYIADPDRGLK